MVKGTLAPPTLTVDGSFTPGLLLFSAPGSGARLYSWTREGRRGTRYVRRQQAWEGAVLQH
jgi:hypothetical protein